MIHTLRRSRILVALLMALVLVAAACGNDDDTTAAGGNGTDTAAGGGGGDGLSGEIVISGSSTVEPISAANAQKFNDLHPDVAISVDGPGTGDGFEIFCNGESDVSNASRPIQEEEIETCANNGIEFIELTVGIDGLSVITNPANGAVGCVSFEQLYALLGPESIGFDNWSDANDLAEEVGGEGDLPDLPLEVTAPGEESGTYDSFVEIVIEEVGEARVESGAISEGELAARPDYQASPNDNVIIEAIGGTEGSLGWVGFAFVAENPGSVKAPAVDGGDGCVEPTPETIASGEYPIARPLFIYVNAARAEQKPELAEFVDFYLSADGWSSVTEVGYVALEPGAQQETEAAWVGRTTGSRA